ncbi:uncharacterized protein LOC126369154 [Pectinophora gossypiella]|uniref:uncharacterized protein LOC126369154 n=1 Tax=Pectinophora gossypiella TaxID=13191 RepID=UPI00214DF184|nr:uncharacterized protein LOC126369154 [Pectinophora gossypiella]
MLIPTCLIKFLELTLAVACLTLHHYSFDLTDVPALILCSGTYVGYIVVFSGEIIGETVSAVADAYVDAWWSASGSVLFAGCGYLTLAGWRDVPDCTRRRHALAAGVCAVATAALLLLDAIMAVCSAHKDETSSRAAPPAPRPNKPCTQCA